MSGDNNFKFTEHVRKISESIQEWETTFNSFIKSCKRLDESRKENNQLANVQPFFSLPILNELIETRLNTSMKLVIGKYQEESFDARDKFNHTTDHLFSILNSFMEAIINYQYVLNNHLSEIMSLQNILSLIDSFKTILTDECDFIRLYHFKQIFANSFDISLKSTIYFPSNSSLSKRLWCNEYIVKLNTMLEFLI
ncbi:hypothetical protein EWB00_008743 [Schistosoma japonicum]|uniref:Uncharacterized protein n=1 Tax=Schistosoma japonicum TaxID=6182 RepID=A0A4Z2DTA4_SCHJA|nr:hypothetical protein EWB00_008743 [Schistosoma japonicum]